MSQSPKAGFEMIMNIDGDAEDAEIDDGGQDGCSIQVNAVTFGCPGFVGL